MNDRAAGEASSYLLPNCTSPTLPEFLDQEQNNFPLVNKGPVAKKPGASQFRITVYVLYSVT
jgi:hypothetical protein